MAIVTTIDPTVIMNHLNTRLSVIFFLFFFLTFSFNIEVSFSEGYFAFWL